jgi:hypothetical protein
MNRNPAISFLLSDPSRLTGGSTGRIRLSRKAEQRKEPASTRIAYGAEIACTNNPPRLGPTSVAVAALPKISVRFLAGERDV